MNLDNRCFNDTNDKARIKQLEKQVAELKQSRNDFKKKADKWKRRYEKAKPYFDTMARHNDRLRNENESTNYALENIRAKLQEVCPHEEGHVKVVVDTLCFCDYCGKPITKELF